MESSNDEINKRINLSKWILRFDKHLLTHPEFYKDVKEYFYESYKDCYKLRKEFHNEFLPELDSNLGFPSSREYYRYEYFFKPIKFPTFDLANNYYYDDNLNLILNKSFSSSDLKQNTNKYENSKLKNKPENISSLKKKIKENNKNQYNNDNEENIILSKRSKDSMPIKEEKFQSKKSFKEKNILKKRASKASKKKLNNYNKLSKRLSSSREFSNDTNNDFDDDIESVKDSISNNNMETFGKQVDDTDEHFESKELEESNMSLNSYQDILVKINEDEQDINNNKKIDIPNLKKTYKSKRFKNIDEHQNQQNSSGLNSARFRVSKKDLFNNNPKEDKNDKDKNNNENIISFPNHQKTKSSYELYKKFSKRKK